MTDQTLSAEENDAVADMVREALARRRITRQYLADQAKISLSTLEKALSGQRPFTLASIVRLEAALGLTLRRPTPTKRAAASRHTGIAPEELGSYARPAVSWIEGDYLTIRPSFSNPDAVYAYLTCISWNEEKSHLTFRESERVDAAFTQDGHVSIPHQSGYIYLITNKSGQYRFVIVSRPTIAGEMFGILTTLQSGRGMNLMPVSTPIIFVPAKSLGGGPAYGRIEKGHAAYTKYKAYVTRALEEPFALLIAK
ncbi:helix-turn-helix transcriptional regulator [Nordella sp. HKS 07]|uniref:helix-turn-helix domain-containing protein n=1 Tax=Nordella sp. HKS 07 TaxID=2712222 RepID=UPI0013E1CB70|nr:helix-turn-helix transcriptional regulator [Nordella sp. HKS 07]QIG50039.1 helix-turn-helix transcriptional regulator [Nordella sp. HKS 07]